MAQQVTLSEQDWQVRLFIYQFFVEQERPPTSEETSQKFGIPLEAAQSSYHRLNERHQIFLDPGTDSVRMANPLSAVPTRYQLQINGRQLWANCAWDALGIPAMLNADAEIEARDLFSNEPIHYQISDGKLISQPYYIHFPLPVRHWYDDLIHT